MFRAPWSLLWLAAALRLLVCVRTAVPSRDGATYLWLAERVAAGEFAPLCQAVFQPLYPALVGGLLALLPGLDPFAAGQLVGAGLGALAVLPLWALARALFGAHAALWAGLAYATIAWFSRHAAECQPEAQFCLLAAGFALALFGDRPKPAWAGLLAGLAYLTRPEGLALVFVGGGWLLVQRRRAGLGSFLALSLPLVLLLVLGRGLFGAGPTLSPEIGFDHDAGIGQAASPVRHYLAALAALPLAAAEELGWLWLPLAIAGIVRWRPHGLRERRLWLLVPFALQCAVVPLLHAHPRFLCGPGVLLLPFAGAFAAGLHAAAQRRHRALAWLLVLALAGSELRVAAARNQDRVVERDLGRHLGAQLRAGETLVSDMPRLCYFAGRQPPPPRRLKPAEILALAAAPECRFVVLVAGRTAVSAAELRQLGLEPMDPPGLLSEAADRRGIQLFAQTRAR